LSQLVIRAIYLVRVIYSKRLTIYSRTIGLSSIRLEFKSEYGVYLLDRRVRTNCPLRSVGGEGAILSSHNTPLSLYRAITSPKFNSVSLFPLYSFNNVTAILYPSLLKYNIFNFPHPNSSFSDIGLRL
jgi:hypothetical protein